MTKELKKLYAEFLERWRKIFALEMVSAIVGWDERVMMPKKGSKMRADGNAVLGETLQKMLVSNRLWRILSELEQARIEGVFNDPMVKANIREAHRRIKRSRCISPKFASELEHQASIANFAWQEARQKNDPTPFFPELKKMLEMVRKKASLYADVSGDLYTALFDEYEPGCTVEEVRALFSALSKELVSLVAKVRNLPAPDTAFLKRGYDKRKLERLSRKILGMMGLVLGENCRLDTTVHPFMTGTLDDVRMATRYNEGLKSLGSALHEGGHALYEAGLPGQHAGQPVCNALSLGFHEAQSRFWEVIIGQSREFLKYFWPFLKEAFPLKLKKKSAKDLYRVFNSIRVSPIRVNSDPLTYNLHILLRFEIEEKLISGELEVEGLPEAWNNSFEKLFGFRPVSFNEGFGQDVHWSGGSFAYFPTYTLGNMRSAQMLEKMEKDRPKLWRNIASGKFSTVRDWLWENVYQRGSLHTIKDLDLLVLGEPLGHKSLIRFLKKRYGDAYGVSL